MTAPWQLARGVAVHGGRGWNKLHVMRDDPRIGTVLDGYRIEEKLGEGGMGIVYRAHHLRLRRDVALKLVRPEMAHDPTFRRRFDREMQLAASIQHAHLVTVHDAAETSDGDVYLTMQLVEGQDLQSVLSDCGSLRPARAARIVMQVAQALDVAHAAGLVHRDVKPSNILVGRVGSHEHAYLTDFGVAKRVTTDAGLTRNAAFVGTIAYAAPEQIRGLPVDVHCDVYSLACVLYRMVAGKVPFPAQSDSEVAMAHRVAPRPRISDSARSDVDAAIAGALDAVLARAMAIEPGTRYASAGDLGRAAVSAAEGRPEPEAEGNVARGAAAPPGVREPRADAGGARHGEGHGGARRGRMAVAALFAFIGASAVGGALARDAERSQSTTSSRAISTKSLELRVPAAWRQLDRRPQLAGSAFAEFVAARGAHPAGPMVIAGMVADVADPTLLPQAALEIDGALPRPDIVELGALRALRYRDVRLTAIAAPATLYAVPTDRGVATVVCIADAKRADGCDEVAATLRVRKGRAFTPGARADLARRLNAITAEIARAQRRDGAALRDARRPPGQAVMAERVGQAYARAARRVGALRVSPSEAAPTRQLARALRGARDAYRALASAARRRAPRTFSRARRSITRALELIDRAIASFARSGYATR